MNYYLNSDGSRFPKINRSGYGGYIKDSTGTTLVEYTNEIKDNEQKHNYELWGLITGLEIAQQMEIKKLICRCDDKTLIKHINAVMLDQSNLDKVLGTKKDLIQYVYQLTKSFDKISFEYVFREQNKYSDLLSRKYTILIEKNFLIEYNKLKSKSNYYFENEIVPPHSIYFHNNKLTFVPYEYNPFILSQTKNKKQKEFRKSIINKFNQNWEITTNYKETFNGEELDSLSLKKYDKENNGWEIIETYLIDDLKLNTTIDIFNIALDKIYSIDKSPWIFTDIEGLTDIFYQKKPLSKEIFHKFLETSHKMNQFNSILYHRTPKFIEKILKEKNKKPLNTLEETVQLIHNTQEIVKKNKLFGQLMSIKIKELGMRNETPSEKLKIKEDLIKKYNLHKFKK